MLNTHLARAVVRVREMILRGELAPGQRVAEAPVAELLGMSRTPVRQALVRLAQEGLLAAHETRGYIVRSFTPEEILDAIDLRGLLEGLAARRVAERGAGAAFLEAARDCLAEGDSLLAAGGGLESDELHYGDMNARLHQLIVDAAGSRIISDALERNGRVAFAGSQAMAFEASDREEIVEVLRKAHRQHHAVIEAIERGDGPNAEALMRGHSEPVKQALNFPTTAAGAPQARTASGEGR